MITLIELHDGTNGNVLLVNPDHILLIAKNPSGGGELVLLGRSDVFLIRENPMEIMDKWPNLISSESSVFTKKDSGKPIVGNVASLPISEK